jgi:hypothetical protein
MACRHPWTYQWFLQQCDMTFALILLLLLLVLLCIAHCAAA